MKTLAELKVMKLDKSIYIDDDDKKWYKCGSCEEVSDEDIMNNCAQICQRWKEVQERDEQAREESRRIKRRLKWN